MNHGKLTPLQADLLDTLINGPRMWWTIAELAEDVGATLRPCQGRIASLKQRGYVSSGRTPKAKERGAGLMWRATKEGIEVFQNTTTIGQYPVRSK